jgi:hypothetical protein
MAGRNRSVYCSWNDDTSATTTSRSRVTASTSGRPMFPAATTRAPAASSISVTKVVTVVLPLVPVIATKGTLLRCHANSISLRTGMPARWAASNTLCPAGTPGLGTTKAMGPTASSTLSTRRTPSSAAACCFSSSMRSSSTTTSQSSARSTRLTARPVTPRPTTSARTPISPELPAR